MSKRAPVISVLTANRLQDGIVVFLGAEGAWEESIDAAAVARSPEGAQALEAQGVRDAAANLVVEPYLAEVREIGSRLVPVRVRERVRVAGPSILNDVPGYVAPAPSPRATPAEGVRPLAPDLGASPDRAGEGSDPFVPASGERGPRASAERESAEAA